MKTMKDYHNLYLKCDIFLLTDVLEKFRNNILKNYALYQSHYLSAPDLIQDAMLKMTKVELELIPDTNMYIFFKKGVSGGISYISNLMTQKNNQNIYIYLIYMFMQCLNFFQQVDSSG